MGANDPDFDIYARAQEAGRLLENDLLWQVLEGMEGRLMTDWTDTGPHDADDREQMWHRVKAIHDLRDALKAELDELAKAERLASRNKR